MSSIAGFEQAFITATDLSDVAFETPHHVVHVKNGTLVQDVRRAASA